jgi:hypothetical protein
LMAHHTIYMDEYSNLRICRVCGKKEMYGVPFPLKGDLCLKCHHEAKHERWKKYQRGYQRKRRKALKEQRRDDD